MLKFLDKYKDFGLLIIRIGIGLAFTLIYGWPKISGGAPKWEVLGASMKNFGINFLPVFWGFMSAFAEFFGGISLILGAYMRPMMILLTINMCVAISTHVGSSWSNLAHPLEVLTIIFAMFFLGSGKYSVDNLLKK